MKSYSQKGKRFSTNPNKIWAGVDDTMLSYEEMSKINEFWLRDGKTRRGYSNYELKDDEVKVTQYIPKKSRNKKDVVAAHRRSGKKTERNKAKQEIINELNV
jgi:hypothetical protein